MIAYSQKLIVREIYQRRFCLPTTKDLNEWRIARNHILQQIKERGRSGSGFPVREPVRVSRSI
jgi:hypothetical protein